jgi:DNA-binding transcriptional LysR family regulator
VPASLARALTRGDAGLVMRQPPYPSGVATTRAVWHNRHDHDAAHAWLRDTVAEVARAAGAQRAAKP